VWILCSKACGPTRSHHPHPALTPPSPQPHPTGKGMAVQNNSLQYIKCLYLLPKLCNTYSPHFFWLLGLDSGPSKNFWWEHFTLSLPPAIFYRFTDSHNLWPSVHTRVHWQGKAGLSVSGGYVNWVVLKAWRIITACTHNSLIGKVLCERVACKTRACYLHGNRMLILPMGILQNCRMIQSQRRQ